MMTVQRLMKLMNLLRLGGDEDLADENQSSLSGEGDILRGHI